MDKSKWEYKKLGEVCTVVSGSTPKTQVEEFWNGSHYWITPAELDGSTYVSKSERLITDAAIEKTNLTLLPVGTVLLSSRAPIGKVAITTVPMYCNQGFKNLICSDTIYNKYLYWFLKVNTEYLNSLGRGATFKEISKTIVENIKIPLYSLADQQRIVAELDCLNEMIALKQEQLKEFDKLAQSIFYDMFGDGNWKSRKIKDIAKVKIGPFGSSLHQYDYITGGTPLVNPIHMINGKIVVDNDFTITEEKKTELTSYLLKTNDIVFGRRGDIGRCALVTDKENGYLCGTGSMFVRFDIDIDPTYALCELSSKEIKKYLLDNAKGATMLNINGGIVENIPIPLPPLALQQQFAEKIQAIEAQKELVKKSIAETQQLLDSRMDYYFD